jgi:rhodanese-related sulfurtransferase
MPRGKRSRISSIRGLRGDVPSTIDLSVGEDFSGRSGGYTHAIFARFGDRAGLREYLEHPAHLAVVQKLDTTTAGRIVVDYEFGIMDVPDFENITASRLKARLDAGDRPVLLDVREPWEFELASIEGSMLIPMLELEERFTELDPGAETVVICHHGNRSSYVTQALQRAGFEKVFNLEGGLDAYSFVDESVPPY